MKIKINKAWDVSKTDITLEFTSFPTVLSHSPRCVLDFLVSKQSALSSSQNADLPLYVCASKHVCECPALQALYLLFCLQPTSRSIKMAMQNDKCGF